MPTLVDNLGAQLAAKQEALVQHARKALEADTPIEDQIKASEQIAALETECGELAEKRAKAIEIEAKGKAAQDSLDELRKPRRGVPFPAGVKNIGSENIISARHPSMGELFAKSYYAQSDGETVQRKHKELESPDFSFAEYKTTMTTAAGFAPENLRSGRIQLSAQRPLMVADILPTITVGVNNGAYVYMEETTFTNNAAEAAENAGSAWGEAALAFTERSETVRKIATFLPVTDEQLADVNGMQDYVNGRLSYMVQLRLDSQLLNGDGNAPNVNGFYNRVTQAQAKGADPVFDAIFKGMIKVMHTGFAAPTAIVLHPNDWQDIRLLRTVDGIYIMGNPQDPGADRIFGLPTVVTTAATENTGLVGDFTGHSALVVRQGLEFKVSDSHSDYFVKGLQAVRCTMRGALVCFRISAFCEITGI
jgi:HK97 family phage major capsid protein